MYETLAATDRGSGAQPAPTAEPGPTLATALAEPDGPHVDQALHAARMAAVGDLTAGVVHEINNPLFAILGLVEFLLADAEPGTKAHQRLTLIQETGLEIKAIARALLAFARERAGTHDAVDLAVAAAETVELFRRTSAARDVEMVVRAEGGVSAIGSAVRLKQLLVHLLANAREALPRGGTVTVAVARREGEVVLEVADTGAGIPPVALPRIFEPFFTTRSERGAAGLGLTAARAIAEAHGGTLVAESAPGSGARLTLRLPAVPATA
jgi:two-component system NtrC family sensor kinase